MVATYNLCFCSFNDIPHKKRCPRDDTNLFINGQHTPLCYLNADINPVLNSPVPVLRTVIQRKFSFATD